MYSIVSTFSKSFDDIGLIYFVPDFLKDDIKVWQLIEIPFREKIEYAIVLSLRDKLEDDIKKEKIKPIISIVNQTQLLNEKQIELISWISSYYFSPIHKSLDLFFPNNLKEKLFKWKISFDEKKDLDYSFNFLKKLTIKQKEVYNQVINSENNNIYLYWLTWSGKTEIFINLIKYFLDQNKQVVFLSPEIILSKQLSNRIKNVFWESVALISSDTTQATKTKLWLSIYKNETKIVIWTRSALFYPYNNLWLIILDEEQDNSYISENSPKYKTDEVCLEISKLYNCKLVLASGTPSIKNMYKALNWDFELIQLLEKYKKNKNSKK